MSFTPIVMSPPATVSVGTVVQGLNASYSPSLGLYTITDPRDVLALLNQGWRITSQQSSGDIFLWSAVAANVNASTTTASLYGTAAVQTPDSGVKYFVPLSFDVVFGSMTTETVTVDVTTTWSDGTTTDIATYTATTNGTTAFTNAQLRAQFGAKDGLSIASVTIKSKSSITSSSATVAINAHGVNKVA